jgi:hypothetical protein
MSELAKTAIPNRGSACRLDLEGRRNSIEVFRLLAVWRRGCQEGIEGLK